MATELISEFVDLTGLNSQKDAVLKALNEMQQGMDKLAGSKVSFEGAGNLKQAGQASKQYIDAVNQLDAAQQKLIATSIKLAKADEAAAKAATASAKAQEAEAKAKERTAKYTASLNKEKERLNKETIKEEERLGKLNNAYEQLKNKYAIAANTAKQLAAAKGLENEETKEAIEISQKYYNELIKIEKAVGQSNRNVGNYTQATFALNQVLREAPAFANSFATGISAISNNLPMLTDEFKKLRESTGSSFQAFKILAGGLLSFNALLPIAFLLIQSYGSEISSFFKGLLQGTEAMDAFKEKQELLNEALSEGGSEYQKAVSLVSELKTNIDLAKEGLISKEGALKQYNETIGETTGKVNSLDEAEKALAKNADAYVKMMLYKSAANLSFAKAAQKAVEIAQKELKPTTTSDLITGPGEEERRARQIAESDKRVIALTNIARQAFLDAETEKDKENAKALFKQRDDLIAEIISQNTNRVLRTEMEELEKIGQDFQKRAAEISSTFKFDFFGDGKDEGSKLKILRDQLKAEFELKKKEIEDEIGLQQFIADNEDASFTQRSNAAKNVADLNKKLAKEEVDYELDLINIKAQEEKTTIAAYAGEILKIRSEGLEKQLAAETQFTANVIAIRRNIVEQAKRDGEEILKITEDQNTKALNSQIEGLTSAFRGRLQGLEDMADAELQIELDKYKRGEISKEEYERNKLEIENRFRRKSLLAEIEYYENLLKIVNLPADKEKQYELELAALKKKLNKEDIKDTEKTEAEKDAIRKKQKKKLIELGSELRETAFAIMSAGLENEKNQIRGQIDALEEKKQKDIEVANQTISNAQERAAQIAVIEARANAEKERLERRRRTLDEQKARYDKAKSIADIIQGTTLAVINALSDKTMPSPARIAMAAIIGAMGAAQLARVIATPIPKYKHGKSAANNYEGPAIVGDGGKAEAIIRESGEVEITPNKDTLTWIGKNDVVLPDASKLAMQFAMNKTNSIAAKAEAFKQSSNTMDVQAINGTLNKGFGSVVRAVKESKPMVVHKGINRDLWMKYGSNYTNYI